MSFKEKVPTADIALLKRWRDVWWQSVEHPQYAGLKPVLQALDRAIELAEEGSEQVWELIAAWSDGWDCSADPGHVGLAKAFEKADRWAEGSPKSRPEVSHHTHWTPSTVLDGRDGGMVTHVSQGMCVNCGFPVGFSDGATVGVPCSDHRAIPTEEGPRRWAHLGLPLNRSLYRPKKRPPDPKAEGSE